MIKTLIIDDEPLARSVVAEYLQGFPEFEIIQECNDGFEGIKAIMQHKPDLIFLDIQMPKISGFEMLELLECTPDIIFTTAFDEFALKAFEAQAIDYLLKPFSQERFNKAINKWLEQRNVAPRQNLEALQESQMEPEEQTRIVVKEGQDIRIIPLQDIHFLEAYDDYVKVHTKDGFFLKKKTMSFYEKNLNAEKFVRIHRSYILALQQLTRIETMEKENHVALLKNGKRIPLSKTGYVKLKAVLGI